MAKKTQKKPVKMTRQMRRLLDDSADLFSEGVRLAPTNVIANRLCDAGLWVPIVGGFQITLKGFKEANRDLEERAYLRGAMAAAAQADDYATTHPYRLSDCILAKINLRDAKPRKNTWKLQAPKDAMTQGMVLALAEMHRATGDDTNVCAVARAAGITIAEAKASGADGYDWKQLKKAGVP